MLPTKVFGPFCLKRLRSRNDAVFLTASDVGETRRGSFREAAEVKYQDARRQVGSTTAMLSAPGPGSPSGAGGLSTV
jgi:hypothetical protein